MGPPKKLQRTLCSVSSSRMEEFFSLYYSMDSTRLLYCIGRMLLGNNRQDGDYHHLPPGDFIVSGLVFFFFFFCPSPVPCQSVFSFDRPTSVATVPSRGFSSPEQERSGRYRRPSAAFYGIMLAGHRV